MLDALPNQQRLHDGGAEAYDCPFALPHHFQRQASHDAEPTQATEHVHLYTVVIPILFHQITDVEPM